MKMKILTVAVYCAYFVTAFSKGFNRTMSGQLTGKALPPLIVHSPEITRKLSTLLIINSDRKMESFGVLLGRDRIAFPEISWKENAEMKTFVHCFIEWGRPLGLMSVFLKERIPEEKRLYLAEGIVEVELGEKVPENCWPPREHRYTDCAAKNEMKQEDHVFAITLAWNRKDISEKSYVIDDFEGNRYVEVGCRPELPLETLWLELGEPLFYKNKIAGMYLPKISDEGESEEKKVKYVLFRKQSIGQSSN